MEAFLKERSDEFRMYPSKRVWHSIYNDLHPSRKWPSMAMSMTLVVLLLLIGYLNTGDNAMKNMSPQIISERVAAPANPHSAHNGRSSVSVLSNTESDYSTGYDGNNAAASLNTASYNDEITTTGDPTSAPAESITETPQNPAAVLTVGTPEDYTAAASSAAATGTNPLPGSAAKNKNVVEEMDAYINSNQLLADVAQRNNKGKSKLAGDKSQKTSQENNARSLTANDELNNTDPGTAGNNSNQDLRKNSTSSQELNAKTSAATDKANTKNTVSTDNDPRPWMEDYALHNKPAKRNWKDYVNTEFYFTPSVGYRNLQNNAYPASAASSGFSNTGNPANGDVNNAVSHKPALNLEAGVAFAYAATKWLKVKAGVQFNYSSYGIDADKTIHPTLTNLRLNGDDGHSYLSPRTSAVSNVSSSKPVLIHNTTFQVSVPVGFSVKLAGFNKLQWYLGGTIQPSYVLGGKANLISSDYQNYISDASLLRKWNVHYGVETYVMYKWAGYTIQLGPQYRYQLLSTYSKKYSIRENMYNAGIKFGVIRNF